MYILSFFFYLKWFRATKSIENQLRRTEESIAPAKLLFWEWHHIARHRFRYRQPITAAGAWQTREEQPMRSVAWSGGGRTSLRTGWQVVEWTDITSRPPTVNIRREAAASAKTAEVIYSVGLNSSSWDVWKGENVHASVWIEQPAARRHCGQSEWKLDLRGSGRFPHHSHPGIRVQAAARSVLGQGRGEWIERREKYNKVLMFTLRGVLIMRLLVALFAEIPALHPLQHPVPGPCDCIWKKSYWVSWKCL